jgi:hypothetical protein
LVLEIMLPVMVLAVVDQQQAHLQRVLVVMELAVLL